MMFTKVEAGKEIERKMHVQGGIRAFEVCKSREAVDEVTADEPSIPGSVKSSIT